MLEHGQALGHLLGQAVGLTTAPEVGLAGLRGDREAWRDRQPQVRHLGKVGALATEQVLEVLVAFGEVVDVLHQHTHPTRRRVP
jgi:hypothetical protein